MESAKRTSLICLDVDGRIIERIILRAANEILCQKGGESAFEASSNNYDTQLCLTTNASNRLTINNFKVPNRLSIFPSKLKD